MSWTLKVIQKELEKQFYLNDTYRELATMNKAQALTESDTMFYRWLNVKELLAWNRWGIWSLSGYNGIETNNHLVRIRTLWLNGS